MRHRLALAIVLGCACHAAAQPFGAASADFRVNTTTAGVQFHPAIAQHSPNSFVVVWDGYALSDPQGVFGQRYGFAAPVGGEFRVNTTFTGQQTFANVGASPSTVSSPTFVVVWASVGQDGDGYAVFAQRYDSAGPLGSEFRVNTHTTGFEYRPDVALDGNGDFVVVWEQPDADGYGVFGRRYASTGAPQDAVFRVNTYTSSQQKFPAVAKESSGSFMVVWQSFGEFGTSYDIVGRRFASTGAPLGDDFLVEATTSELHAHPAVAPLGIDAGFVVAWMAEPSASKEIYARRYDTAGVPLTGTFRVNTYTTGDQDYPAVAGDSGGTFTVVWRSDGQDGDQTGVYAQRYDSTGAPAGGPLAVNTYTTGKQDFPRVAMPAAGWFTVTWSSLNQDGSNYGVYARQFCDLTGDATGDDAITVADVFFLINHLFAGGPGPVHNVDVNGDRLVDVSDVFYLINYLFAGGPPPACLP